MADAPATQEFFDARHRTTRAVECGLVAAFLVFLLTQMAPTATSLVEGYMAVVAAFIVLLLVGVWRSLRVGFVLDDEGVTLRGVLSSKRWRWEELRLAAVRDRASFQRSPGMALGRPNSRLQVIPSLTLANGRTIQLYSARINVNENEIGNWVDDAIAAINARLDARRAGGTPPRPR